MSPTEESKQVEDNNAPSGGAPGLDIAPEIKEIFVEEAGDVIANLREYFPQWRDNVDDKNALAETRRAFHTLKGSGRMVSAEAIGELAWSVCHSRGDTYRDAHDDHGNG